MAENPSFFRKVVRFVANPATDWTDLNTRPDESRELELEKSELKAMIERKRRNDFVRKREFDVLRRVRREGLSPEQLAALGGSSRLDDSVPRSADPNAVRPDRGVKAKIDAIEQQMVGDGFRPTSRRGGLLGGGTVAGALARLAGAQGRAGGRDAAPPGTAIDSLNDRSSVSDRTDSTGAANAYTPPFAAPRDGVLPSSSQTRSPDGVEPTPNSRSATALPQTTSLSYPVPGPGELATPPSYPYAPRAAAAAPLQMGTGLPPLTPLSPQDMAPPAATAAGRQSHPHKDTADTPVDVSEVVHDPELDEAVIAFANADFTQCEHALTQLTGVEGARAQHPDTWLVLFDLYRATGQQQRFESLALEYAQQFGWSAPQWYSLPKLVADAVAAEPATAAPQSPQGSTEEVGWVCPELLDIDAVAKLRSQTLQLPLPWVLDWSQLAGIEPEAAMRLSALMRLWAGQALDMRWVAGDKLFDVLAEAAPTGVRDADPVYWLTRLDALRLANRVDQFDEAAIDYCVTYEVSPPSWEPARCNVHISGANPNTRDPQMSRISEVSTSFLESGLADSSLSPVTEVAHVELSGQLVGDIGEILRKLEGGLSTAPVVSVNCTRLIRVDFIAAGDLLNWVLTQGNENRAVHFVEAHRLVALFFGAMGINEHAKVRIRKV